MRPWLHEFALWLAVTIPIAVSAWAHIALGLVVACAATTFTTWLFTARQQKVHAVH